MSTLLYQSKFGEPHACTACAVLILVICAMPIGALGDVPRADDASTNLALGKPYYALPAPSYWACKDDDDDVQLTDGSRASKGWMDKLTVGWSEGGKRIGVLLDLQTSTPFDTVVLSTLRGPFALVYPPHHLKVYASDDAKRFDMIGDFKPDSYEYIAREPFKHVDGQSVEHLLLALGKLNTKARYILVVADRGHYYFLDEVMALRRDSNSKTTTPKQSSESLTNEQVTAELLGVPIVFDDTRPTYQTPHWRQASKLATGPIDVLAITPAGTCRDIIELDQRLDMSLRAMAVDQGPKSPINGLLQVQIQTQLENQAPQVLVMSGIRWQELTDALRNAIVRQVQNGMGLLLTDPKLTAEQFKEHALDLSATNNAQTAFLSKHTLADRQATVFDVGKGKVAILDYNGATDGHSHTLIPPPAALLGSLTEPKSLAYEFDYSLVAHSINLLAGNKPVADSSAGQLHRTVYNSYNEVLSSGVVDSANADAATWSLPGKQLYVLHQWLDTSERVVSWQCSMILQEPTITIETINVPVSLNGKADTLNVTVTTQTAESKDNDRIEATLKDPFGRVVANTAQPLSGANNVSLQLAYDQLISRSVTLHIDVFRDDTKTVEYQQTLLVQHPNLSHDGFRLDIWTGSNGMLRRHYAQGIYNQTRSLGTDALYSTWPIDGLSNLAARANVGVVPENVLRIAQEEGSTETIRVPSLASASFNDRLEERIRTADKKYSPYGYDMVSLGDESYLASTTDSDRSPETMAQFADWLSTKFADVSTMNNALGTQFATFAAAIPPLTAEVRKQGNCALWLQHRLFMFEQFSNAVARGRRLFKSLAPHATYGISGAQLPNVVNGHDYAQLAEICDAISVYGGLQRELLRSFTKPNHEHTMWSGFSYGYTNERYERFNIWTTLFHGYKGIALFNQFEQRDHPLFSSGYIGPDLTPHRRAEWMADTVRQIRQQGLGLLLDKAVAEDTSVGVVYSTRSMMLMHVSPIRSKGYIDPSTMYIDAVGGTCDALEHLQLPYRIIDDTSLQQLNVQQTELLILPMTISLSDQAIESLRRFAEAGGCVVFDVNTGRFNEHGRSRPVNLLARSLGLQPRMTDEVVAADSFEVESKPLGNGHIISLGFSLFDYSPRIMGGAGGELLIKTKLKQRQTLLRNAVEAALGPFLPSRKVLLTNSNGDLIDDVEVFPFSAGQSYQFFGILKEYDQPGMITEGTPADMQITWPTDGATYELIKGNRLGSVSNSQVSLRPAEARFFAKLPAKVEGIAADCMHDEGRITIRGTVTLMESVQAGDHAVRIEVVDANYNPRPEYSRVVLAPNGKAKHMLDLAQNDPSGKWSFTLTDTISGKSATVSVNVPSP